jgi:hypothetical protein
MDKLICKREGKTKRLEADQNKLLMVVAGVSYQVLPAM